MIPSNVTSMDDVRRALALAEADVNACRPWRLIPQSAYQPTPHSHYQLRASDPTWVSLGYPLRWIQDGEARYGVCASANTSQRVVGVSGPHFSPGTPVTAVWVGSPDRVVTERLYMPGEYGTAALLNRYLMDELAKSVPIWQRCRAYLARVIARQETWQTLGATTDAEIQLSHSGRDTLMSPLVIPHNTNNSVATTHIGINPDNYHITFGERYEPILRVAQSSPYCAHLTVHCSYVLE